jgi:hypothetical protein
MDLPSDVLRLIVSLCKIREIENLCYVDKSFYSLCCEKNLWLEKFKEKNLEIINTEINTIYQYIDEYKKVSYAIYTTPQLVDFVMTTNYRLYQSRCFFDKLFLIDDLKNILVNDHPIFTKICEDKDIKEFIDINIVVSDIGSINYGYCDSEFKNRIDLFTENYTNKEFMISLINKIFYHHPSIVITDVDCFPIIMSKNSFCGGIPIFNNNIINNDIIFYDHKIYSRRKYWDECYSKYKELYF